MLVTKAAVARRRCYTRRVVTQDPEITAALALHRFGFGPRPGGIAGLAKDARDGVLAELDTPNAGVISDADLPGSASAARAVFEDNSARRARRTARQPSQTMAPPATIQSAKPATP